MSKKALDQIVEDALARVLAQHLVDPYNNPVNTAVFGSPDFLQLTEAIATSTENTVKLTQTVTYLLDIIKSQNERIAMLTDCVDLITRRLERDSAGGLDVSLSVPETKPEKPN